MLLEALAMEKPCVATNKYGMPEVVIDGKTGYVFPSGDVSPNFSPSPSSTLNPNPNPAPTPTLPLPLPLPLTRWTRSPTPSSRSAA